MMLVETLIGPSTIHGTGLFAAERIAKGAVVWRFTPGFDQRFSEDDVERLPDAARSYVRTYAYRSKKSGLYVLPVDNGRYFNHASNPNTLSRYSDDEEEVVTYALRDIENGEELTDDYSSFEEFDVPESWERPRRP